MTRKQVNKKQTSTLNTMSMSPPIDGGRRVPRELIPYDGTKEEEIEALKLVFRIDGSNPFKDDACNINRFKPMTIYDEADSNTYVLTLHSGMNTADKYVAIEDLMKHMFSIHHIIVEWIQQTNMWQ
jgi:CCR4-NOT transcriptional regulation complex NOT5 subunit